jgi:hypothetical protein
MRTERKQTPASQKMVTREGQINLTSGMNVGKYGVPLPPFRDRIIIDYRAVKD